MKSDWSEVWSAGFLCVDVVKQFVAGACWHVGCVRVVVGVGELASHAWHGVGICSAPSVDCGVAEV